MEKIIEEHPTNRGADEEDKPTTLLHYNANDWLVGMTDPLGRRTDYGHDALGRVTTVTLPLPYPGAPESARSTYTTVYGALGHIVQEIDPDQKATSFEIDDRGRVDRDTLPQRFGLGHSTSLRSFSGRCARTLGLARRSPSTLLFAIHRRGSGSEGSADAD